MTAICEVRRSGGGGAEGEQGESECGMASKEERRAKKCQ
jgi:hypothetical protein